MLGIDIVDIKRIKDNYESIAKKILSEKEYSIFLTKNDKISFVAGRFAAKEAFLKAQGKGLFDIPFKSIEVLCHASGQPYILYNGKEEFEVSIAHEKEYAIAVVKEK